MVVGGVEVHPDACRCSLAEGWLSASLPGQSGQVVPGRVGQYTYPGVRGIGPDEAGFARRWLGQHVAADVAGGQARLRRQPIMMWAKSRHTPLRWASASSAGVSMAVLPPS